jgi:hypothetical protein
VIQFVVPSVEWKWAGGEETPFSNHKRLNPYCGFIKGFVGNIPIDKSEHLKNLPVVNMCADVGSLRALFLEIFLFTSLKHLKNLPVVKMCANHL